MIAIAAAATPPAMMAPQETPENADSVAPLGMKGAVGRPAVMSLAMCFLLYSDYEPISARKSQAG
jgi:hypothetical protein